MFKQLRDWMICGTLNDRYDEFYIIIDKNITNAAESTSNYDEDLASLSGTLASFSLNNLSEHLLLANKFSSNYSQYKLSSTRLPSYLNMKCANKILFTGELLQLFQAKFLNEINNDETFSSLDSTYNLNKTQFVSEFDKCRIYTY